MALQPFDGELDSPEVSTTTQLKPFDGSLDNEKSGVVRRAVGDTAISALKGAVAVPEMAVGLADIATGGVAGKVAEEGFGFKPKQAKEFLDEYYSPEQKEANRKVAEADGFIDTVKTAVENPSTIAHTVVESLPAMGAGGVAARALKAATGMSPVLAGAIGEGAVGAGLAAEGIRQETDDGLLTPKQSLAAAGSGVGTAVLGAAGGKLAQKLGINDIDTIMAGGAAEAAKKGVGRRILEAGISEGVFEELPQSVQEQIWSNVALDRPMFDGVDNAAAMGLLTGGVMGGFAGGAFRGRAEEQAQPADLPAPATAVDQDALLQQATATGAPPKTEFEILTESLDAEIGARKAAAGIKRGEQDVSTTGQPAAVATETSGLEADQPARSTGDSVLLPSDADRGSQGSTGPSAAGSEENQIAGTGDSTNDALEAGAHEAATSPQNDLPEPTPAQKEAGNYKVGRAKVGGLNISVENPDGSTRSGKDKSGKEWSRTMNGHYGYVKGVKARAPDKEHIDVNVKPGTAEDYDGDVYVVNQIDPATGQFDEPKVYIGYASQEEAESAYRSNYDKNWKGMGGVVPVPMPRFKEMLQDEKAFLQPVVESDSPPTPSLDLRPTVEALVKRRAAAAQLGKERTFDAALAAAKKLMDGQPISASKFKTWANMFKRDESLYDLLTQLQDAATNTPEALAAKENRSRLAKERAQANKRVNTAKDDVLVAMAKLGGLNLDQAKKEWGLDPQDMKSFGSGIMRSFNNSANSKDLDTMREELLELGYPVGDTVAAFGDTLSDAMGGFDVYTPEGTENIAQAKSEAYYAEYDELSDEEQAALDLAITEATRIFGSEFVTQVDVTVADANAGKTQAEIERELTRVLNEEIEIAAESQGTGADTGNAEDSGNAEGTPPQTRAPPVQTAGDELTLSAQSQQDLAARDQAKADQRKADETASKKAEADSQVNDFVLTGSDRPADQAAARGARDLFSQPTSEVKPSSSWVISNKETGEVVMETFDRKKVDALNTAKYEAVPIQEHLAGINKSIKAKESTAPEHADLGVDDRELGQIVNEFKAAHESMFEGGEQVHHLFDAPAKNDIVRLNDKVKVYHKDHGWMTVEEAKARIAEWKAHAKAQGKDDKSRSANSDRIVLSLFDLTGKWSQPWEEAGYQVYRFDIQSEEMNEVNGEEINIGDINNFSHDYFADLFGHFDGNDVYAILAACPCTDFAVSGARHFKAKDKDGRTAASVKLVHMTQATIEHFKPAIWAIENPVGRIEELGSLPPWRLSFDPNHIGDPYTKKTLLWGRFNADLPIAPVEPTEGSKMHQKYGGKSLATKNARSATPEGFSYGFFMANNAIDHPEMAIANKYDRLDRELITQAVKAGVTEAQIDEAVEDYYYMDLDDAAANNAIRGLTNPAPEPDRRTNTEQRKRVEQMSSEEMRKALLVDDLTGLGNRRAYDESEKLPVQVSVDVDSLKWVNDNMGHESGDVMLKAVGEAIGRVTANGYHVSGDEFIVQTNTVEEADSIMANVRQALDNAEIEAETPSGEIITKQGLGVSYGTGSTLTEAERGLQQDKSNREQTGQRAGRGETPSGVARKPAGGQQNQERDTAELDSQPVPAGSVRISKTDSGYLASFADDVGDIEREEINVYLDDAFRRKIFDGVLDQDISLDQANQLLLDDAVNNPNAYTGTLPKPIEIGAVPEKSVANPERKPDTPLSIFDNAMDEYDKGIANVDDYKAAFQYVLDHEKDITDYLNTLTKKQLFDRGGYNLEARYKSEKKERVVSALYSEMVSDFLLPGESGMRSYSASFGGNRYDGIKQQVEAITQDSLNKAMQRLQDARKANAEKKAEQLKGIADPQTLDDYTNLLRTKMADGVTLKDARMSLTPEQRAKYDELYAERTMADRAGRKEAQKTDIRTAGQTVSGDIIETKHTKKGHDLFVVQLSERVSREDYETLNTGAKKLDGYYSSYRGGGAVPGFQFTERANAEAFVELAGGNKDAAQEAIKARRDAYEDDRAQSAVERLTEMAGKLEEAGQEDLNRDRKANTHRRAEAAARAEAKANAQIAMAKTMRNIATAIDSGEAKFLGKVRQKVQVELLQGAVNTGHYTMLREKYKDYREYEKHKDAPPTMEAADYAEFPQYTLFRSDWAKLGRQLSETEGTKTLGKKILSIADDVSDAYVKWAKDNLLQVSLVGSNGERAVFSTKDLAERAIERSGFNGKAIPISFKRGEHMIVLSPSEAQLRGFWKGDDDKRITLNSEFGKELVEKIGKLNRRTSKVELPWQLESAHEKREKYARMGIENPSEFRAALREFIQYKETPPQPDKVKELERKMIGRRNDGLDFFPTPAAVADEMIEAAGLEEGMSVLEPSAGMGHIAERIREAGVEPDVVELSGDRRELLEAKGFNLVASDFMDVSGQYDRIIMNPPFSDRRDEQHVRHAYNLLKPGGRVVAIMGEGVFFGSDKRATEFREWLESVGGTSEKLEEGTFMDPSLPVNTGVAARMVVIEKQDGPLFSRSGVDQPFYSQMSRVIEQSMGNAEPVAQLKMKVQAWAKQGKFKQDELQWSGLMEWLDMQTGKVQKQAVLDYLDANGVRVDETVLGEGTYAVYDGDINQYFENRAEAEEYAREQGINITEDTVFRASNRDGGYGSKYDTYTVPGGENYKELLLTLPAKADAPTFDPAKVEIQRKRQSFTQGSVTLFYDGKELGGPFSDDGGPENNYRQPDSEWMKTAERIFNDGITDPLGRTVAESVRNKGAYKSSHFHQPNILAHVRFDERTDADGKRVLFINEIQSDWGQEGKKKGFGLSSAEQAELAELKRIAGDLDNDTPMTAEQVSRLTLLQDKSLADRPPSAPFVTKTDAWVALAIKRMARYAAENGFDRVAFINGEQAAGLYDLSKQVDKIEITKRKNGGYLVGVFKGEFDRSYEVDNDEKLADLVGKDLAEKAIAQTEKSKEYAGLDLVVGDKGMRTFYDKIVPNVAKDVLKKIGGTTSEVKLTGAATKYKVEQDSNGKWVAYNPLDQFDNHDFPTKDEADRFATGDGLIQPGFDITPEMREQIMQGLPLFSKAGSGAGMSVSEVKAITDLIKQKWDNAPDIVVVQDMSDKLIRPSVRAENERQLSQGAAGQPEGFFDAGKVFVVASEMASMRDVARVVFHETLGHYGLRGTFGDALKPILNEVSVARRKDVIAKAKQYGLDINNERDRLIAAEEVLAEMAQTKPELSFVQRAIAAIRTWLRKFMPDLDMTDAEIIRNILEPARQFVQRGGGVSDAEVRFSRSSAIAEDIGAPPAQTRMNVNGEAAAGPEALPQETFIQAREREIRDKMNRFRLLQEHMELMAAKAGGFSGKGINEARKFMEANGIRNPVNDQTDVHQAETTMHGKISTRIQDFRELHLKPLIEKTQKSGVSLEDVADFLKVQHAPEANARMRLIHGDENATAYGVSDAEANTAMDGYRKLPEYDKLKALSDEWRAITSQSKQILLKGGIISQEQADAWDAAYQMYVPVKGEEHEVGTGKGLNVAGKQKGRLGHGLRDEKILENILRDHERAIALDEKNRVGMTLLKFLMEVQNPAIGTFDKPVKRQVLKDEKAHEVFYKGESVASFKSKQDAQAFILRNAVEAKRQVSQYGIKQTSDPRVVMQANPMLAENEVNVYVAGHAVRIQLNDEIAARAYTNLGVEHLNGILSGAREFNSWLSKVYTGYNPEFALKNLIRDAIQGTVTLTGDYGADMTAKIYGNYGKAVKELWKSRNDPRLSKIVTEYRMAGGSTGASYLSDLERIGNDVMSSYNEYAGAMNTYQRVYAESKAAGKSDAIAKTNALLKSGVVAFQKLPVIGHFLTMMERINAVTENALRLATFMTLRDNGISAGKAAASAKNLMNFNRKGEISNQAGALYLFFNPNIQGTARLLESLGTSEHKGQAQALAGTMALSALVLAEAMRGGSDDDERRWKKIPTNIKDRNMVILLGDDKQLTIPVPYGFGIFHSLGNAISDLGHGESIDKISLRLSASMLENFSPVGNPLADEKLSTFQLLPTIPKLALAPTFNENSFGSPIAPTKYSDAKPDSQNMFRTTKGSVYADIATALNEATGGNEYQAGLVDVSPEVIKFWVSSLTGGAGRFIGDAISLPVVMSKGADPDIREVPVVRSFVRESGVGDSRRLFWKEATEAKIAAEEFRSAIKAHDTMAAREILEDNRPLIRLAKYAERMEKVIKARRDAIDVVRTDDSLSLSQKREKMKEIEAKEMEIYDTFTAAFENQVNN